MVIKSTIHANIPYMIYIYRGFDFNYLIVILIIRRYDQSHYFISPYISCF